MQGQNAVAELLKTGIERTTAQRTAYAASTAPELNSDSPAPLSPQIQTRQLSSLAEACGKQGRLVPLESPKSLLRSAYRSKTFRAWLWYVLRQEFRTFLSRTRYALGSQAWEGPVCGPAFEPDGEGNWLPCQQTLARIEDTQQMSEVWKRWAVTPLDSEIFLLGWTAGARWAEHRNRTDTRNQYPAG
jgi:hypothetical protein